MSFEPGLYWLKIEAEKNSPDKVISSHLRNWKGYNRVLLSLQIFGFCYLTDINDGFSSDYIMGS